MAEPRQIEVEFTIKTTQGDLALRGKCPTWSGKLGDLPMVVAAQVARMIDASIGGQVEISAPEAKQAPAPKSGKR